MNFVFMVIFMIFLDRIIPASMSAYAGKEFSSSTSELYRKYGFFKFPRTFLAILSCFFSSINYFAPISLDIQACFLIFFMVAFVTFAGIDAWKARK